LQLPAEIWRRAPKHVSKLIVTEKGKELASVVVDPLWQTADTDVENNHYPRQIIESRIEAFKKEKSKAMKSRDIMHDIKTELKEVKPKVYQK
ncbi:MAG: aminopeptidase, partial [Thalassotalea sp.]|nr:aminopeptidase [Thalassotalea sp.]